MTTGERIKTARKEAGMTLKEFAKMLDGRSYGNEITEEEEALAKELGFVVVFGYSDDNAELRGAVNDEIGCYDGGVLFHDELPDTILAVWCPDDEDCAWAYGTPMPHEKFHIFEDGDLYCIGIVCDISKPKMTNADNIRAMSDEELAEMIILLSNCMGTNCSVCPLFTVACGDKGEILDWLKQPCEKEDA